METAIDGRRRCVSVLWHRRLLHCRNIDLTSRRKYTESRNAIMAGAVLTVAGDLSASGVFCAAVTFCM